GGEEVLHCLAECFEDRYFVRGGAAREGAGDDAADFTDQVVFGDGSFADCQEVVARFLEGGGFPVGEDAAGGHQVAAQFAGVGGAGADRVDVGAGFNVGSAQ